MTGKNRKIDWLTVIPVLFWIACIGFSFAKLCQSGNGIHIIDCIDIFNGNTFSTYISMIICMAYQFFTSADKKQETESGLARRYIALTIISTCVYGGVAIMNACRYCMVTTVIMAIVSSAYIVLFFKYIKNQ